MATPNCVFLIFYFNVLIINSVTKHVKNRITLSILNIDNNKPITSHQQHVVSHDQKNWCSIRLALKFKTLSTQFIKPDFATNYEIASYWFNCCDGLN